MKFGPRAVVSATVVLAVRVPEVPVIVTVEVPVGAVPAAVNVTTLVPVAGLVAKAAVTPVGRAVAARLTGLLKPYAPVIVTVLVAVPFCITVSVAGAAARVKLAGGVTVRGMEVEDVREPEVPVIVTVAVPVAAVLVAVKVTTLVLVAGLTEKDAVTPAGRPVAARVTDPVKPPTSVMVSVLVAVEPWLIVRVVGEGAIVKPGAALTVSAIVVVWESVPEVPVMVTVTGPPTVAVLAAVSVRTLELVVVGLGLKLAVTPVGNPVAARVTPLAKPFTGVTVMVSVPVAPCVIATVPEDGAIL